MATITQSNPDATTISKGKIQLSGILSGTAASPALTVSRKNDTTNTTASGLRIETGWGYIQGTGATSATKAVTFGTAFSTVPILMTSLVSYKTTTAPVAPNDIGTGGLGTGSVLSLDSMTTSGFTAAFFQTATLASTVYIVFTWTAIGA